MEFNTIGAIGATVTDLDVVAVGNSQERIGECDGRRRSPSEHLSFV
jgi:hypothetical protein